MRAILIRGSNCSRYIEYLKMQYFSFCDYKIIDKDGSYVKMYFYCDELKCVIGECTVHYPYHDNFYRLFDYFDRSYPFPQLNAFNAKIYERNIPISEFRLSNIFYRMLKKNLTKPPKQWCRVMDLKNDNEQEIKLGNDSIDKIKKRLERYYLRGEQND